MNPSILSFTVLILYFFDIISFFFLLHLFLISFLSCLILTHYFFCNIIISLLIIIPFVFLDTQPDVTQTRRPAAADRVNRYGSTTSEDTNTGTGRWKVSAKIQQLLNTLKRPKRRPLPEFYEDDDVELEIAANPKDPNAPRPEGSPMTPAVGEQLVVPSGLPRNLEAAIQRYGSATFKAPVATVLDPNGKLTTTLTYGKFLITKYHKLLYTIYL